MRILTHLLLALLATPCLAWTGSGPASGRWIEGEGKDILAERGLGGEVVGTVDEAGGRVDLLYTLSLPGAPGDGVLALAFDAWTGTVHLPDARVDLRYREYGSDGETVFVADRLPRGTLRVETGYDGRWRAVLDVDVADRQDDALWRRFDTVVLAIDPPVDGGGDDDTSGGGYSAGGHAVASGGCDDGWDDDDDWETDDSTWGGDSGGGCDGDDWESDSDSGSSGCEGDDLDTGDSSAGCDSGGCEGDAIAGSGDRKRRSPVALRLINLVPWLLVFAAIRLMRRRRAGRTTGF